MRTSMQRFLKVECGQTARPARFGEKSLGEIGMFWLAISVVFFGIGGYFASAQESRKQTLSLPQQEEGSGTVSCLPKQFTPWWEHSVFDSPAASKGDRREIVLPIPTSTEGGDADAISLSYWQLYLARARWAIARQHYRRGNYLLEHEKKTSLSESADAEVLARREEVENRRNVLSRYREAIDTIEQHIRTRWADSSEGGNALSGKLLPMEKPVFSAPEPTSWKSKRVALIGRPEIRRAAENLGLFTERNDLSAEKWMAFLDRFLVAVSSRKAELASGETLPETMRRMVEVMGEVMTEVEQTHAQHRETYQRLCEAYTSLALRREAIERLHPRATEAVAGTEELFEAQDALMRAELKFAATIAEYNYSIHRLRQVEGRKTEELKICVRPPLPATSEENPAARSPSSRVSFMPSGQGVTPEPVTDVIVGPYTSPSPEPSASPPRMASLRPKNARPYLLQSSNHDLPLGGWRNESDTSPVSDSDEETTPSSPVGVEEAVVEIPLPVLKSRGTLD